MNMHGWNYCPCTDVKSNVLSCQKLCCCQYYIEFLDLLGLFIYRPQQDEWLSWLTVNRRGGHPSTARHGAGYWKLADQRSTFELTTVLCHQLPVHISFSSSFFQVFFGHHFFVVSSLLFVWYVSKIFIRCKRQWLCAMVSNRLNGHNVSWVLMTKQYCSIVQHEVDGCHSDNTRCSKLCKSHAPAAMC